MKFYKLLDIKTGEYVYMNPEYIVFYMRTFEGVLIDIGSKQILTLEADFEDMMLRGKIEEWGRVEDTMFLDEIEEL